MDVFGGRTRDKKIELIIITAPVLDHSYRMLPLHVPICNKLFRPFFCLMFRQHKSDSNFWCGWCPITPAKNSHMAFQQKIVLLCNPKFVLIAHHKIRVNDKIYSSFFRRISEYMNKWECLHKTSNFGVKKQQKQEKRINYWGNYAILFSDVSSQFSPSLKIVLCYSLWLWLSLFDNQISSSGTTIESRKSQKKIECHFANECGIIRW